MKTFTVLRLLPFALAALVAAAAGQNPVPAAPAVERAEGWPGEPLPAWLALPEEKVTFLTGNWHDLLKEVEKLGPVNVLSGNGALRHMATGTYAPYRGSDAHGLVVSKGIDLRLFPQTWTYGAAELPGGDAFPGFVFFDATGAQVHRILLTPESNQDVFKELVAKFKGSKPDFTGAPAPEEKKTAPLTEEAKAGLLDGWSALEDTHDFGALLNEFNVSRTDALRAARGKFTEQLDVASYTEVFQKLLDQQVSIMVFANNNGCVQISTGALTEVYAAPGALRLTQTDKGSTLIATPRIAEAWRVSKPTSNGLTHSLELYDAGGEPVAYIFASRKEGGEEGVAKWKADLFALATVDTNADTKQAQTGAPADATIAPAKAVTDKALPEKVDVSKLAERTRNELNRIVGRVLEYDDNKDGLLTDAELPSRMKQTMAKADANSDAQLDRDELTALAYRQLQDKRQARAQAPKDAKS
jgi:putative hemin transport protein